MSADRLEASTITDLDQLAIANTEGIANLGIDIRGTWDGTLVFEATITGLDWFGIKTTPVGPHPEVDSTNSNGIWIITPAGFRSVRVRSSIWTSGEANITFNGSNSASAIRVVPATTEIPQIVSGPLTNEELRATPVEVTGDLTVTGGLTDEELRASPVPISGTVTATTGGITNAELRASPVPISVATLPLPTSAATDTLQTSGNASLSSIDGKTPALVSGRQPVESVGNVASGSASSGNPVKVAGVDSTSKVRTLLTDTNGIQQVSIRSPISSFGFPIMTGITPVTQQHFAYGINPKYTKTMASSGSSLTAKGATGNGSDLVVAINTAANAFAIAHSFKPLLYRAGVGQIGLFTAAFNTGVASSQQFAGLWAPDAGYFVGYNGTS